MGTHSRPVLPGPQALTEGTGFSFGSPGPSIRVALGFDASPPVKHRATHRKVVAEGRKKKKEEDEMALSMRRIGMLVTVVALMAAMMVATAVPAFAGRNCKVSEESSQCAGGSSSGGIHYGGRDAVDHDGTSETTNGGGGGQGGGGGRCARGVNGPDQCVGSFYNG